MTAQTRLIQLIGGGELAWAEMGDPDGEAAIPGAVLHLVRGPPDVHRLLREDPARVAELDTLRPRYRRLTRSSTESLGSSPSATAVTIMFCNAMAPLWLSRNAVSAASRPVAIRTIDWRGARHVASTARQAPSTNASATA